MLPGTKGRLYLVQSQEGMYNGGLCLSELQHGEPQTVHTIYDIWPWPQVGGRMDLHSGKAVSH